MLKIETCDDLALNMLTGAAWGLEVFPSLRTRVSATRIRVPDVLVLRAGLRFERILYLPPLIVIEILSPEDDWSRIEEKAADFRTFGTEHFWVFDPERQVVWCVDGDGLHRVTADALCVPGTPIRVVLGEVFAELDRG
jgi:Uma2 family endonuclease